MEATARGEEAAAAGELKSRLAEKAQAPRDIGHVYKKNFPESTTFHLMVDLYLNHAFLNF